MTISEVNYRISSSAGNPGYECIEINGVIFKALFIKHQESVITAYPADSVVFMKNRFILPISARQNGCFTKE